MTETLDTVIIGGGASGLTAATLLARAHRTVTIVDAGHQSNLASHEAHGVFTRDKYSPSEIYSAARDQLLAYPTATIIQGVVSHVTKDDLFYASLENGEEFQARTILFAQGMDYVLPEIDGISKFWGKKVWHCPFCEGYEANGVHLLAMGDEMWSAHMQTMLPIWIEDITWVDVEDVKSIVESPTGLHVTMKDGSTHDVEQAISQVVPTLRDNLARDLGCSISEAGFVAVDDKKMTDVDGAFCTGDQNQTMASVNLVVADGHMAGVWINMHLGIPQR